MAALHEALKSLGPCDFSESSTENLSSFLASAFEAGQIIVESVPPPSASSTTDITRSRANTGASNASEISASSARAAPPPIDIEALQKEWKPVKMNPRDNPLEMSVYKMGGKDGKGSWFARRSVHEGLGFKRWKRALEREFPETMKVQGGPGEGNIRGIGGEERVAHEDVEGLGKMEVYLLSAQFPGPTAPRDFVTMFLTSDQALKEDNGEPAPRHFMVISKPCNHPEAPPRDGYIRGQYESVEFIREIPVTKPKKSVSTTELDKPHSRNRSSSLGGEAVLRSVTNNHLEEAGDSELGRKSSESGRARGKTISFSKSRGAAAKGESVDIPKEESEENPVEWIMITRSDPGGSVPRFLIDRGTPGGIVNDASKFLDWACGADMDDSDDDVDENSSQVETEPKHIHRHGTDLHNHQTNGHLAGLEEESVAEVESEPKESTGPNISAVQRQEMSNSGLYDMVAGGFGLAGGFIASHTPQMIADRFPVSQQHASPNDFDQVPAVKITNADSGRRASISSVSTVSTINSFTSALENRATTQSHADSIGSSPSQSNKNANLSGPEKELAKLEDKKRKLDEKLQQSRLRETTRQTEDAAKEEEALRKASEKHDREIKKQEEKHKKEVLKLQLKREKEERKAEERRKKIIEKDERAKLQRELDDAKAEVNMLKKEKEILRFQVGELQKENTLLAAKVGKMGGAGESMLREVREEVNKTGRIRATSLKGARPPGLSRKVTSSSVSLGTNIGGTTEERRKENLSPLSPGANGVNGI